MENPIYITLAFATGGYLLFVMAYRGIILKSTQHFYAGFQPVASRIHFVACEGAIPPDFAAIPYTKFKDPYWPRVEDPFAEG